MFVIDIEGRGRSVSRNGIVSIGVCIGRKPISGCPAPEIIEKKRFDLLPLATQEMDQKCKAEFWDKQPNNLLERLQENAVAANIGIKRFREYLDYWTYQDPNLYVLCDNPAYDFAFIDYYLDLFGYPTLAYKPDLNFRPLHDADSYARGILRYVGEQWVNNKEIIESRNLDVGTVTTLTAHMPEDDAEGIYRFHYALLVTFGEK